MGVFMKNGWAILLLATAWASYGMDQEEFTDITKAHNLTHIGTCKKGSIPALYRRVAREREKGFFLVNINIGGEISQGRLEEDESKGFSIKPIIPLMINVPTPTFVEQNTALHFWLNPKQRLQVEKYLGYSISWVD